MHFRNTGTIRSKHESNRFSHACTFKTHHCPGQPLDRPIRKMAEVRQKIADEQTAKAFELYIARLSKTRHCVRS